MIRPLLVAATAAGLMLASAALAQQQQQQRMPSSPPPQSGTTMGQPSGPSMDSQRPSQPRAGTQSRRQGQDRKLDSIASGLNACQMKSESERQSCIDQVIRENGG